MSTDYAINEAGVISTPGKFEGEPLYAVHLYDSMMEGGGDETLYWSDESVTEAFIVDTELRTQFPTIDIDTHAIILEVSDQGFVNTRELTQSEYDALVTENERDCEYTDAD